jgi:hypothetical protein
MTARQIAAFLVGGPSAAPAWLYRHPVGRLALHSIWLGLGLASAGAWPLLPVAIRRRELAGGVR